MTDSFKTRIKSMFEKVRKIKHIEIYLTVFVAIIIAIIYFSLISSNSAQSDSSTNDDNITQEFSSSMEYVNYLENKLENVLTKVKGAGNVEVAITLEKGFEYIYATEEETKTTSSGTSITSETVVMVDGQPLLLEEIYPIVQGIVVVSSGADDLSVKLNILSVLQTVIEIDNSKINIICGN